MLRAALVALVVGGAVMVVLEGGIARAAGVVLLIAFVVLATAAIASPGYLARGVEDDEAD